MLVLALLVVGSILHSAFAVLALLVARRLSPATDRRRRAWQMVAFVYLLFAACHLTQILFAVSAFALGPESPVFRAYLWWAPIANHSRTLVVWSLYVSLGILALRGEAAWPTLRRLYPALAVVMLVLGGMIGWGEGTFNLVKHLTNTSLMDAVGFLALATLLFVSMLRDSLDRALWFALLAYGCHSVVSSLFIAALAELGTGAWTPPPWAMEVSRIAFSLAMVGMAVWRLRLARRGIPLPGLLGTTRPRPVLA